MALAVKDLCRFCARTHSFTKELMDEENLNVFKFIKDIVHIELHEDPKLPTKMCLDCEEKVLSFQMFVLECSRVQDTLRKMVLEEYDTNNKNIEALIRVDEPLHTIIPPPLPVKAEVKDEYPTEYFPGQPYKEDSEHSYIDDVDARSDINSPPPVKKRLPKKRKLEKKQITEEEQERFNELLTRPYLSLKDFVKLSCNMCDERYKTWSRLRIHFVKVHKTSPVVYCMCGMPLTSKTHLYKHISDHKLESKRKNKMDVDETEDQDNDDSQNNDDQYANLKVTDFVSFTCTHCGKKYSSWYKLKGHTSSQHRTSPVVTCICGFSVKSKSVLYKHISDHKNPDILSCDKCMKVTKSVEALEKHKLKHIPKEERMFKCDECEKIFNNKDGLKSHMKSHIPIQDRKIYDCDYCNLKFTTRSSAMSHRRVVHEKIKSYICDLCGYTCGTNGELKQHRAIHSDAKPHVCSTCSKSFKTYSNLKTHMDTHESTSYECYICRRVLNSRRTLRKHLLVHDEKCRHVCSYCNKAFKRRQTLKVHLYTHTGDKPLTCRWCEERFAYASTLRSHRLRCHPDKMTNSQQPSTTNNYSYKNLYDEDIVKNEGLVLGFPKTDIAIQTTLQLK